MLIDQAKFIYDFTTPDVEVTTEGALLNEAASLLFFNLSWNNLFLFSSIFLIIFD